jgi:hypothetical protein
MACKHFNGTAEAALSWLGAVKGGAPAVIRVSFGLAPRTWNQAMYFSLK